MLLLFTFLQCLHPAWAASGASHWTYAGPHGQEHWQDSFEACGGDSQSPIDVDTSLAQYDPSLTPVEPEGYRDPEGASFSLQNNGHTVQLSLPQSLALHGLPHLYRAVQLHLHWGSRGHSAGSEHLLDGRAFPAELHVVHFNADKYPNVSEALPQADGLAVLGVFLEVGETENPAYEHLLEHLEDIQYAENTDRPLQPPRAAAGPPGALLPLQRLPDDAPLRPERPLDRLRAARPPLGRPAGEAAAVGLRHPGRGLPPGAAGGQLPAPAAPEQAGGPRILPSRIYWTLRR